MTCTFCRIIADKTHLLDDGEHAVVFLDRNQAAWGHILIVPRQHVAMWHELDEATVVAIAKLSRRWALILRTALDIDAYNILVNNGVAAGQDVMHAHLHVTPRTSGDGYYQFGGTVAVLDPDAASSLEAQLVAARGNS